MKNTILAFVAAILLCISTSASGVMFPFVQVRGGILDNVVIGGTVPSYGTFTNLTTEGALSITGGAYVSDDISLSWGDGSDYNSVYNPSLNQMYFYTSNDGSTLSDASPMFVFQVNSGGGTLDDEQRIFGLQDYNTVLFYVDQDGDVTAAGSVTAPLFQSSGADNTYLLNVANTGDVSAPTTGDTWYNSSDKAYRVYDGAANLPLGVFVSVPGSSGADCVPGHFSADATYFYVCRDTNTWMRVGIATW